MGTTYSIKISNKEEIDINELKTQVDQKLKDFNQIMSTYIADSEISKFNRNKSVDWIPVSLDFQKTLQVAKNVFEKSAGAYDVSVAPLVNRWRFGPDKFHEWTKPSEQEINKIKECIGFELLKLKPNFIAKAKSCLTLDFSSLAKGQGVDMISTYLESLGYQNHMVEIGGEVKVLGTKDKKPWRIGIESPKGDSSIKKVLELSSGECVATSGSYKNFFDYQGHQYSHTIDPITGYPVEHRLVSVTVKFTSCILADAWATAFMVMGVEQSLKLANAQGIWAEFMVDHNGEILVTKTQEK